MAENTTDEAADDGARETMTLRLHPDDMVYIHRAIAHWERWHNCSGLAKSLDATDPEGAATHRGMVVNEAVQEWAAEVEGVDLDQVEA